MAGPNAGRRGGRWRKLVANLRAQRRQPCCLCGQRIDYSLTWPDPGSFSVEHVKDWANHPELREDPANLAPSHLDCNSSRKELSLGETSEAW